jgi:hypothetical protein
MAKLMIKCPVMAHPISTGVEVNSDAEFHSLLDITYHVDCPLCGGSHKWTRLDAWIPAPHPPRERVPRRETAVAGPGLSSRHVRTSGSVTPNSMTW